MVEFARDRRLLQALLNAEHHLDPDGDFELAGEELGGRGRHCGVERHPRLGDRERVRVAAALGDGDERAAAVRDYMVSLGIPANRVMTVSRGEESPFCSDSHEGCWSRNRRGHFQITAK